MYKEIMESAEMLETRQKYEELNLPFGQFYEKAYNAALNQIPNAPVKKLTEVIVKFLIMYLDEQNKKPAKTFGGKLWRFIYTLGGLFSK